MTMLVDAQGRGFATREREARNAEAKRRKASHSRHTAEPAEVRPRTRERVRHHEKGSILRWLNPGGCDWGANIGDFDRGAVEHARRLLGLLFGERRYFGIDVRGWDRVPDAPAMVVSNHSGGTLIPDVWGLCYAWYTHFGTERAIHPTAHDVVLGNRFTGTFFAKRGVVRANRQVAGQVLRDWKRDLLVMPGGDLDTWRPFTKRYRVCFSGRKGYARLALRSGVPIVPVVNAGAHSTLIVLSDGRKLAELLRLPKLVRASIWPVHLSLPYGLAVGPWPHIPIPVRLRYRFAKPIYPEDVGARPGEEPTEAQVRELDARVRAGMQAELDELRHER